MSEIAEQQAAEPVKKLSAMARLRMRVAALSQSPHALAAMLVVAVVDGSVFPVPPFAILIPMCVARPRKAPLYAALGTVASLFGGVIGYGLGFAIKQGLLSALSFDPNVPITRFGLNTTLGDALSSEFWLLALLCSVLPTPYKVVSIGSGVVGVAFPSFMLASLIGRSARFFGVALFTAFGWDFYRRWKARRATS